MDDEKDFEVLAVRVKESAIDFFKEPFRRFEGTAREHRSFFLVDPSNNVVEFKWYKNMEYLTKSSQDAPELEYPVE